MRHLLDFPHVREAPESILERLRFVDATAELLYWGPRLTDVEQPDGRNATVVLPVWLLGTMRPTRIRREAGYRLLQTQERWISRSTIDGWRYAKLLYQGFAPVAFYPMCDPTPAIIDDFRRRDWLFRCRLQEEEERSLAESEGIPQLEARIKKVVDKAQAEARDQWHFVFGNRREAVLKN